VPVSQAHYVLEEGEFTLCGLTRDRDRIMVSAEGVAARIIAYRADHCAGCRSELPKIFRSGYAPLGHSPAPAPPSGTEIENFLAFLDHHKDVDVRLRDGLLLTPGCTGEHGACCSTHFDLAGLADELRELIQ